MAGPTHVGGFLLGQRLSGFPHGGRLYSRSTSPCSSPSQQPHHGGPWPVAGQLTGLLSPPQGRFLRRQLHEGRDPRDGVSDPGTLCGGDQHRRDCALGVLARLWLAFISKMSVTTYTCHTAFSSTHTHKYVCLPVHIFHAFLLPFHTEFQSSC